MMDGDRLALGFTIAALIVAIILLVVHGLAHKKPAFVWPVAWCRAEFIVKRKDGKFEVVSIGMPCKHFPRQQDI